MGTGGISLENDLCDTLRANTKGHEQIVLFDIDSLTPPPGPCLPEHRTRMVDGIGSLRNAPDPVRGRLDESEPDRRGGERMNLGLNAPPLRVIVFMGGQGAKARTIACSETISPSIKTTLCGGNAIPEVVYPISIDTGRPSAKSEDLEVHSS